MNKMFGKGRVLNYSKIVATGIMIKIISFFIIASGFSGCKSFDKIAIGDIQEVSVNGIAGQTVYLEFKIPIENISRLNVKITEVNLKVNINGTYIGKVTNVDKIKIEKKSNEVYSINLKLKIAGLFGALNTLKVFKEDEGELNLEGVILAKLMGLKKVIEINETQTVDFSGY